MLRLLVDECFEHSIIEGLLYREPSLDIGIVTESGLSGTIDEQLLEIAAREGRILLTHDRRTMTGFANQRVAAGLPMPGVIIVKDKWAPGPIIDDILTLLFASLPGEFENRVFYLPFASSSR